MKKAVVWTIVIPCFNKGNLVLEALASVQAAVGTTTYEIIIVDDESSDPITLLVLETVKKQEHVTVIRQKNVGLSGARNTGIAHSSGTYVFFLDNDDVISNNFLELTERTLNEHPEASFTYPDTVFFGEREGLRQAQPFDAARLQINNYIPSACVFRGEVIRTFRYDTTFPALEDWDMLLTLLEAGHTGVPTRGAFLFYRIIKKTSLTTEYSQNNKWVELLNSVRAKHGLLGKSSSRQQDFLLYKVYPLLAPIVLALQKRRFQQTLRNHHYLHHEYTRLTHQS